MGITSAPRESTSHAEISQTPGTPTVPQKTEFKAGGSWFVKHLVRNKTFCRSEQFCLLRASICGFYNTCAMINNINIRSR